MPGRRSALVAGLLEQSKVASTSLRVPLGPNTGKLIQRQEKATQRLASFYHGPSPGGKELVQSRQYSVSSAALAGEPPSRLPRGQADAVASVASEAVEQPVGAPHGRKQG
ncbi:uncharacterized protein TrAFT101_009311 [Trichoderma asperellum]|uniref:Uncharacterized protein n=1 Tax=Trichoderma asperellum (strain ATCC 204424 / CBS 433.97 / NBRC 101777) TaxID=1042311 RepID=A0A2T3YT23_TRIA4|nr:hypothetical protein M441DRAFT_31859 [Trichoderma asperellum CBS 433.97]PTB35654.1 hypothetical protein M441DRAFT_31859 [Trichoderma asperellum CBS 433.97]UKZ94438.1 hypothetical protein TrAFT101_009311 [Trichoderma asperellum]